MDEDGFLARDIQLVQPLDGGDAILFERIFSVSSILCHMDVATHTGIFRNAHAGLDGFVGAGEGCV